MSTHETQEATCTTIGIDLDVDARSSAELKEFELEERKRLGLPTESAKHWFDAVATRVHARAARAHDDPGLAA